MLRHRRWNRFRAWFGGYFWAPCPRCGQMFGGHEDSPGTIWTEGDEHHSKGKSLCPDCPGDFYAPSYKGLRMERVT